jgi:lipopolysaccharide transport system ATP-binding protein
MLVRLAFAVVAHVNADILIIDEALAVGDVFFTQKCMRFIRKFREQGSVLFVSHDTGAIVNLCHKVIWLENGQVKAIGDPKSISEDYLASFYESTSRRKTSSVLPLATTESSGPLAGDAKIPYDTLQVEEVKTQPRFKH